MGFLQYATTPARPAHSHDGPAQKEAGPPAREQRTAGGDGNGVSTYVRVRRVWSCAPIHAVTNMAQQRTSCICTRSHLYSIAVGAPSQAHNSSRTHPPHVCCCQQHTHAQPRGLNAPPLPMTLSSSLVLAHDLGQWLICAVHTRF
jgi:hypothetical protein